MSSPKYLLFFFLASCSLPYFTNTKIKEKQSFNLQNTDSFSATGTFTYFKENATIKGKINLISDLNDNLWISANSLFLFGFL